MTNLAGGPVRVGPVLGMRVIIGVPRPLSRATLNHALEALVRINQDYLRSHPGTPSIYDAGVRYAVEPDGFELWDPIPLVIARGAGDCDDLAAARAAELREAGETGARADCYPSRISQGRRTWHAIVVRADGTVEDPSARLGMRVRPGHILDGQPFEAVVEEHAHLEGEGLDHFAPTAQQTPQPQLQETRSMHVLKWEVRPLAGGGWQGTVWFAREARSQLHSVSSPALPSPGDAIEQAFDGAQHTAHALEAAGFDLGSMIPGLLNTGAELVRTFTGGSRSPSPMSAPPQWQQLATTAAMRAPMMAPQMMAPPMYAAPSPMYAAPMYAPPMPYGKG